MSRMCELHIQSVADRVKDICHTLCTPARIEHMLGVESLARKLVPRTEVPDETIRLLSWGHDMFRDLSGSRLLAMARHYGIDVNETEETYPTLLHGKVAANYLVFCYDIDDEVRKAIHWHVTGSTEMGELGELLLIADMGEEGRPFEAASRIRLKAFVDKKKTVLDVLRSKMLWSLRENRPLQSEIVLCWNNYLRRDLSDAD